MYTILQTTKLKEINPRLYLNDTLARIINAHPINRIDDADAMDDTAIEMKKVGLRPPGELDGQESRPTTTSQCRRHRAPRSN
jgi:hypothetical protein